MRNDQYNIDKIISHSTYLSNILFGGKPMSSSEIIREYAISIASHPQLEQSNEILNAGQEQVALTAARVLKRLNASDVDFWQKFFRDNKCFYFKRNSKFSK